MNSQLLALVCCSALALTACQMGPKQYDGVSGYQIESKNQNTAVLTYTLAGNTKQAHDLKKMQGACQNTLGKNKTYQMTVLNTHEVIMPNTLPTNDNLKIGNSRTSIGLSNTVTSNSIDDYATRQALDTKPSTLKVIQYTCS